MKPIKLSLGLTLIEVLIALVVLAFAVGSNLLLFTHTLQHHQRGVYHAQAVLLASSTLRALNAARVGADGDPERCDSGDVTACLALERAESITENARTDAGTQLPNGKLGVSRLANGDIRVRVEWRTAGALSSRFELVSAAW